MNRTLYFAALALIGCGGDPFTVGDAIRDPGGDSGTMADSAMATETGDEGELHPDSGIDTGIARDSGTDAADATPDTRDASDSGSETDSADAHEAGPPACTCGDAGTSCWYSADEPPVGSGMPGPVTTVVLTPASPSAHVAANIVSPAFPNHNAVWFDIDVSAFATGATLQIGGQVGTGATDGTTFLLAQCDEFPATGGGYSYLENIGNVPPGPWTFPTYAFAAGTTVLHLGTEGSWYNPAICDACTPDATNTNTINVTVQ